LSVQEEERRKISRELHDVIAQTLSGINVRLATLKTESAGSIAELHKKISSTQRLVEKSVDIVHRFARELRPTVLDDLGLIPALQSFMKGFMEDTGIRVSFKVFAGIEEANGTTRTMLYRVAQEALNNVARHAKASQVEVSIKYLDGIIHMDIKDDGQGFDADGKSNPKQHNRLGLIGMRERVEMVGGTFRVESTPGNSTTVHVEIPAEKKPS
ncbi:MAG: sensor histidine kinase, partial [Verrucomicrobia bacterium]|nr:sensor histidine kinase [Verrucomicrobiota bacterium]